MNKQQTYLEPQVGFRSPDFELIGLDGNTYNLSDFKGHPVLINFWASWCKPCQSEMPAMEAMYRKYESDGFVILAVNATNQDSINAVEEFVASNNLSFPVLLDTKGEINQLYRVQALPTSFFINPQGLIEDIVIGGPMSEALLETRLERLKE